MICVGVALVRSTRDAMDKTPEFIVFLGQMVSEPTILGALIITPLAALAEVVGAFPTSAFLAGQMLLFEGELSFVKVLVLTLLVCLPIGVGTTIGALPHYALAFFGGKPAIEKFKKYTRVSWESVEAFEKKFFGKWYDEIAFLLLRMLPLVPTVPINLLAGILRMRLHSFVVLTVIGITIRMTIIVLIFGYTGGGLLRGFFGL